MFDNQVEEQGCNWGCVVVLFLVVALWAGIIGTITSLITYPPSRLPIAGIAVLLAVAFGLRVWWIHRTPSV